MVRQWKQKAPDNDEEVRMLKHQVDHLLRRNQGLKTQISCLKAIVSLRELPRNQRRFSEPPLDKRYIATCCIELMLILKVGNISIWVRACKAHKRDRSLRWVSSVLCLDRFSVSWVSSGSLLRLLGLLRVSVFSVSSVSWVSSCVWAWVLHLLHFSFLCLSLASCAISLFYLYWGLGCIFSLFSFFIYRL